jgi:hypothetical protein
MTMATKTIAGIPNKMGRKKGERKTILIRVYMEDGERINQAASERRMTVADFFERFLIPCTDKAHREYIRDEAKRLEDESK